MTPWSFLSLDGPEASDAVDLEEGMVLHMGFLYKDYDIASQYEGSFDFPPLHDIWFDGDLLADFVLLPVAATEPAAPRVLFVDHLSGAESGGTAVMIGGNGFLDGATVAFGGGAGSNAVVVSPTLIAAITPAHAAGMVDVTVTNPGGETGTLAGGFAFSATPVITAVSPGSGTESGGTFVTIDGTGFEKGSRLTFGGRAAAGVVIVSATRINAVTPPLGVGPVDVTVTNPNGLTDTLAGGFTAIEAPGSHPVHDVKVLRNVGATMRDRTVLYSDVYLPDAGGAFPVIIERTPYDKSGRFAAVGRFYAARGYAVVIQDTRGRYTSEGDFYPFEHEGWQETRDGYDTVEWAASQPWSDGKVGMIGGSYSGVTQYGAAPTRPPHLAAMFVRESSSDYHEEWTYRGGALELAFSLYWAVYMTKTGVPRLVAPDLVAATEQRLNEAFEQRGVWYEFLPLGSMPVLDGLIGWYRDWLEHPDDGPYWQQWNVAGQHDQIDVPIYHLGAWYDIFLRGTLENYKGIRDKGMSGRTRKGQKLIIGPWEHGPYGIGQSNLAGIDFGPEAAVDLDALRLRWFDHHLKEMDTGLAEEPPVRIFVMGKNEWRYASNWPPEDLQYTGYYFHSAASGSAASLNDGSLSPVPPAGAEDPDSYTYDPHNPVRTRGGGTLGIPAGPYDQRPAEAGCLTYTTEPLQQGVEVTGPVTGVLYASSDALDTDWVVKLCDVYPDGRSILVADGILRARYRDSRESPSLLEPDRVYRCEVDLWATSNFFAEGHRIRVAVSSSNFPRFDRNLNTGGEFGKESQGVVALNTLFHDAERPSHILLPVRSVVTAVEESASPALPAVVTLAQNYPNPFNSNTVIPFAAGDGEAVDLAVYNLAGQRVATLLEGLHQAGAGTAQWDGRDDRGRQLASGVYLYRLRVGEQRVVSRKLLLLR